MRNILGNTSSHLQEIYMSFTALEVVNVKGDGLNVSQVKKNKLLGYWTNNIKTEKQLAILPLSRNNTTTKDIVLIDFIICDECFL